MIVIYFIMTNTAFFVYQRYIKFGHNLVFSYSEIFILRGYIDYTFYHLVNVRANRVVTINQLAMQ